MVSCHFRYQKQQHFHVSFDGSAKIPRHDQLHSPRVQLRQVSEGGCEVTKGHFPYEYIDCLERLDDTALPSKEAFFSRLKNEGISDEDYASCQEAWRDNATTILRDFLVWYNNRDVVLFLQAIDRQFAFYQLRGIDMFKQGISVPGLTFLYLFNDLPEKTYFTIFNEKNKDLHHLVKDHVVGGASLIFHRYHEKGVTTPRQNEYGEAARPCRSIVGYDANALYLWSLMQDMPMGWYTRRREDNDFRPELAQLYEQVAAEWLTWESERSGRNIRHQINSREKRIGKLLVDGWCSETNSAYQFHGCFFMVTSAPVKRSTPSTGNTWLNYSPRPERKPPTYVTLSKSSSCGNASGKR